MRLQHRVALHLLLTRPMYAHYGDFGVLRGLDLNVLKGGGDDT